MELALNFSLLAVYIASSMMLLAGLFRTFHGDNVLVDCLEMITAYKSAFWLGLFIVLMMVCLIQGLVVNVGYEATENGFYLARIIDK